MNRWVLLVVIVAISLALSYLIYTKNSLRSTTSTQMSNKTPNAIPKKDTVEQVFVQLKPNYDSKYVDVYLTSSVPLISAEFVFNLDPSLKFNNHSNADLFKDYWVSKEEGNKVRIAGTGGALAEPVTVGTNSMFARLNFDTLTKDADLTLDISSSTAFDANTKSVPIKLEYN
ncbi:hypothetical protein COV24_00065 [candidate division WWE3 bacterium CG10_big_fil_rev_8_21_14_0_10_32_10]|uniref:Cohesin domain-containing protein n=1 Tax=candidate division WWE3 bacterium CG10_big_fil_rev_8_21_14_0_10_32_10 TaxID=1975090 RepID=A0A2H0RBU5_UNCKA|nr:MAG: hypothetical protein COV24_00065 [candidate division WWE3 bacterium CG10_big_fil_rev_8_21_14_0_10_32_10]